MEPDRHLVGEAQAVQGFAPTGGGIVDGTVAGGADGVEEVGDLTRQVALVGQTAEEGQKVGDAGVCQAGRAGDLLGKSLDPGPQLEQGRLGVGKDVALGLGGQADQQRVMAGEEGEVDRCDGASARGRHGRPRPHRQNVVPLVMCLIPDACPAPGDWRETRVREENGTATERWMPDGT